jgi:hypothetical protein
LEVVRVLWKSLGLLLTAILGAALFLYGGNYYTAIWGWTGVYLIVGVIMVYLAEKVYGSLKKGRS